MSNSILNPNSEKDEWSVAAGHAKEAAASAGAMVSHLGCAVGALASQTAGEIGKQTDELAASAGVGVQVIGDRLSHCCPQSGMLGTASQTIAQTVKDSGEYLEEAKLSGMTSDVVRAIRQNPVSAILVALGLGWCVGRKLRS